MATILNLGCGVKTCDQTVNIDWSINLRIVRSPVLSRLAKVVLSQPRRERLEKIGKNIVVHDLSKGIPYDDNSVDAVYHSHVLEHIDRNIDEPTVDPALLFIKECRRVLKSGGVLRIVVPDLERRCRAYVESLAACEDNPEMRAQQDEHVRQIVGQAAMKVLPNTKYEHPIIRKLENAMLGDARARGQTHQWEYDRFNLEHLLRLAGFTELRQVDYHTSWIDGWRGVGLDLDEDGAEYKPHSIYFEARK